MVAAGRQAAVEWGWARSAPSVCMSKKERARNQKKEKNGCSLLLFLRQWSGNDGVCLMQARGHGAAAYQKEGTPAPKYPLPRIFIIIINKKRTHGGGGSCGSPKRGGGGRSDTKRESKKKTPNPKEHGSRALLSRGRVGERKKAHPTPSIFCRPTGHMTDDVGPQF